MEFTDTEAVINTILLAVLAVIIIVTIVCYLTLNSSWDLKIKGPVQHFLEKWVRDWLFTHIPEKFNNFIRTIDFTFSKSYGHGGFKFVFQEGYPKAAYILIFLALFFLFGGLNPELSRDLPIAFVLAVVVTVLISILVAYIEAWIPAKSGNVFLNYIRYHALHVVSSIIILILCALIWLFLQDRHIHIPIIAALLILSLVGILVRCVVFKNPKGFDEFAKKLPDTNFIKESNSPEATWASVLYGLISGPTHHVLKLLLLPAWIIIWLPTFLMDKWIIWSLLGLSWFFLAICTSHRKLQFVLRFVDRWFLTGGQFFVSLLIIILAAARMFEVSYVSTLLDGAPFFHVLFFMAAAYSSLLLYEFWSNSILCHHLIYYLRPTRNPEKENLSRIPYTYNGKNYCLQLYSGARFALVEWSNKCGDQGNSVKGKNWLSIYEKREVFSRIASQHKDFDDNKYSDLSKRVMLYFTVQNLLLIGLVVLAVFWILAQEPEPLVTAQKVTPENAAAQTVDLKTLIMEKPEKQPAIFVAASGGGTRAAIYTTAVLAGLREQNQLGNVVLASGVSGGGMSLAYFSANRNYLLSDRPVDCSEKDRAKNPNAWCDYIDVVSDNHIRYVASHVGNTDIYTDTSLGKYLTDSFRKTFVIHHDRVSKNNNNKTDSKKTYYETLDQLQGMGLILNTALVAHPYSESAMLDNTLSQFEKKQRNSNEEELFYKFNAGGRLIFTNLKDIEKFPEFTPNNMINNAGDVMFKYLVGGGKNIPLPAIGALTANFPPVFPNAIVKLDNSRFRVTDGGAVENRGLISLLYALRSMLEKLTPEEMENLPPMHIVMAEASGESIDYKNYMTGLTAKSGSGAMIANQLILELKGIIQEQCKEHCQGKLKIHYLSMPLMMRARGGLGTHWKMPSSVTVQVPADQSDKADIDQELDGHEMICLMQELFTNTISKRSSPRISTNISTQSEHIRCKPTEDPLLRNAFLDNKVDVRSAWKTLVREFDSKE